MKIGSVTVTLVATSICLLGLYQLLSGITWLRYNGFLRLVPSFRFYFKLRRDHMKSKCHVQDSQSITCKNTTVRRLDPSHPSVLPYIPHFPPLKCRRQASVVESKVDREGYLTLIIIKNNSRLTDSVQCYFQYIRHPTKPYKEDEAFVLSKRISLPPENRVKLQEDFVYVSCINRAGYKVYENFHLHMVKRDEPISKKYSETTGKQPRLNVLIMVNDGVSLSSAARYIPKTLQYLSNEMNGTIFTGFHALGENSLPNIFPVLTGLPHSEASIDAPFIWKHFSEQGYKTFYLEDTITATISYIGDGFAKPPTDYYTHPFWVAMENSSLYWDSQTFCLGDMPIHRIAIKYLANYVEKHRYQSYFALYFLNAISHHSDTVIQLGDEDYRDFLIDQKRIGHFNNTIMLFMSDHGSRFGRIRSTPIGHLEARNPMLIMVLPPWLRQQYPHIAAAVNSNADRLVTPYDIHATLLDILHSRLPTVTESTDGKKHEGGSGKGLSLFRNLPIRRTCASAGIPEDTCTLCTPLEPTFLDVNSQKAHLIASTVLTRINDIINATSECDFLHISKIIYIAMISDKRPCFTYSVIIKTVPGRGIFEASVRETTATASVSIESPYFVITPVIRLSLYDSNCCCTEDNSMNKYCHCKMTTKPMRRKAIPNGH